MDSKNRNRLLAISAVGLAIAGLIFLGLSIFGEDRGAYLPAGLACVTLGNLFTVLRNQQKNTE